MSAKMRVLVTGGESFLGEHVVKRLREEHDLATCPRGMTGEPDKLAAAAEGRDVIVHLDILLRAWVPDPEQYRRVNIEGLRNVVDSARRAGVGRVVYVSTFLALGPTSWKPAAELPETRETFLGECDASLWEALRLIDETEDPCVVTLIPTMVYGPGKLGVENHLGRLMWRAMRGRVRTIIGTGYQMWNFVYVEDVAEACAAALRKGSCGAKYVIGGENVRLSEFFNLLGKLAMSLPPERTVPVRATLKVARFHMFLAKLFRFEPLIVPALLKVYDHNWAFDSTRAEKELGVKGRPLLDGLVPTVRYYEQTKRANRIGKKRRQG